MAHVTADRVLESSTTTGTGALALAAAYTGYQRFSAVCSVADTVYYCIEAVDGNGNPSGEWEVGLGTYSSANTLTRTTPSASSNAGAAVNLSAGTKRIMLVVSAGQMALLAARGAVGSSGLTMTTSRLLGRTTASTGAIEELTVGKGLLLSSGALSRPFVGALVHKAADETTANYSSVTAVPWTSEASGYDTDAFHDNSSNNSRLTVPDLTATYGRKAAKISLHGVIAISSATAADWIAARFNKNGAAAVGLPFLAHEGGATTTGLQIQAHNIPVVGDGTEYFELAFQVESDTSITVASSRSAFGIQVTDWQ